MQTQTLPDKALGIRAATEADVPVLVTMTLAFLRGSEYAAHVAENPDQKHKLMCYLLGHPDGTVLVGEAGGIVVGMIGLMVVPHLFSGELTCGEVFWYVDPAHRGSTGIRLLRAAERWARDRGATVLQMIAPNARVGMLYQRLGYLPLEVSYTKRLEF